MTFLFSMAPIFALGYLAYILAISRQVKFRIYSGKNKRTLNIGSYLLFGMTLLLLGFFIFKRDINEILITLALCVTAYIAILQSRVAIGENGIYMKLQFHPWSVFQGFRWQKKNEKNYWTLYLYKSNSIDILSISIPDNQVSRLDLILQNKIGMAYQERA